MQSEPIIVDFTLRGVLEAEHTPADQVPIDAEDIT